MFSNIFTSWKTTLVGVLAFILSFASANIGLYFDADPLTNPDYDELLQGVFILILGVLARDSKVTDEEAFGLTKPSHFRNR